MKDSERSEASELAKSRKIKCDGKDYEIITEGSTQRVSGLRGELGGKHGAGEIRDFIRTQLKLAKPVKDKKAEDTPCGETPQTYDETTTQPKAPLRTKVFAAGILGTVFNIQKNGAGTPWLVTIKIDGMRSEQPFKFCQVVEVTEANE